MLSSWFRLFLFFLIGLDRAEKLCLEKWGMQMGQTFPYSIMPRCPKMHWQEFVPVGQSWEEERLNPSASHKPTVLSDPVLWTAQLSFLFQKDGAERNDAKLSCGTKELFGYPLQSSQTVRDHSLTQRLLYLPQCTSVWDLFWWGMETNHSAEWELLVAEDPEVQTRGSPFVLNGKVKFFKWKKLKDKNTLSGKFERVKWGWSLEPSHRNATMQRSGRKGVQRRGEGNKKGKKQHKEKKNEFSWQCDVESKNTEKEPQPVLS